MSRWTVPPFAVGANLPWLTYGCDVGANVWAPGGGCARPEVRAHLRDTLARLADSGASLVRWFVLCDGRAGLLTAADGGPGGLDACVLRDLDAALEEFDRARLRVIPVLFDFHWFHRRRLVNGVQLGGRGRWLAAPAWRARLIETAVAPLLDRYGRRGSIAAWDIINEPEWVTRHGRAASWLRPAVTRAVAQAGVSQHTMRAVVRDIVELVHTRTAHAATVGSSSAGSLDLVRGLDLDLYQVHWYDRYELRSPLSTPVAEYSLDRPVLLGEFPTRGSRLTPPEIVETARTAGYAGALAWSYLADDVASDRHRLSTCLGQQPVV